MFTITTLLYKLPTAGARHLVTRDTEGTNSDGNYSQVRGQAKDGEK